MNTKSPPEGSAYTGRDIFYREGVVGFFDVQRAADALLRQGRKPSVAGIREQLGGGSPNTITPLLGKYWHKLGERLVEGPDSLERVPEALARVTELLWRRALEEARERQKLVQQPDHKSGALEELQEQISKLSVALAEARAREGEHLTQLSRLSREYVEQRQEHARLLSLLKGAQALLGKQAKTQQSRPAAIRTTAPLHRRRRDERGAGKKPTARRPAVQKYKRRRKK